MKDIPSPAPFVSEIQAMTCSYFGIDLAQLLSSRRDRPIARPRQIAMYLAREVTGRSISEIGRRFGGRDHTTIIHGARQIERLIATDAELAEAVGVLRRWSIDLACRRKEAA